MEEHTFEKRLAKSITHYIYRNTALEDYHADGVTMSAAFYDTMYGIISEKLKTVVAETDAFLHCPPEKIQEIFARFSPENTDTFERYVIEISFGFHYGTSWDEPVYLTEKPQGDLTAYVLGGQFRAHCEAGACLDDAAMCRINKDVYNRVYTLLSDGWFYA